MSYGVKFIVFTTVFVWLMCSVSPASITSLSLQHRCDNRQNRNIALLYNLGSAPTQITWSGGARRANCSVLIRANTARTRICVTFENMYLSRGSFNISVWDHIVGISSDLLLTTYNYDSMENREVCTDYYLNSAMKFGFEGSMIDPNSNFSFLVYAEHDKSPIFVIDAWKVVAIIGAVMVTFLVVLVVICICVVNNVEFDNTDDTISTTKSTVCPTESVLSNMATSDDRIAEMSIPESSNDK